MTTPSNGSAGRLVPNTAEMDYRILKTVSSYEQAQELVDRLSDGGFPVEKSRIVGTGLRSVEQITGRMTTGRAAGRGALGGLWFGLMIGLLFLILAPASGLMMILLALGFGAVWGAVFGALGHPPPAAAVTSPPSRSWRPSPMTCSWRPVTSRWPHRWPTVSRCRRTRRAPGSW